MTKDTREVETRSHQPQESFRIHAAAPLRDQVAARMRVAIAQGSFRAGERLVERELCELLGVSRTSVREAMRQLEAEGLISNIPNKGPIVSTINLQDVENIYETRAVLEGLVGQLFARRASDEQMSRLQTAFSTMEAAYALGEIGAMVQAKSDLYAILIEGADNDFSASALRSIHIRAMHLRALSLSQPGRAAESLKEVRSSIGAIIRRDEAEAWSTCVQHVRNAGAATLALFRNNLDALEPRK